MFIVRNKKGVTISICNYCGRAFNSFFLWKLFLCSLTVAAHELIYASCSIHKLALTGIEGVRGARDFDFNHWVSFAFEFYCVVSLCGRTRKEHIAVGHVLEHDGAIVFWMKTFFH